MEGKAQNDLTQHRCTQFSTVAGSYSFLLDNLLTKGSMPALLSLLMTFLQLNS